MPAIGIDTGGTFTDVLLVHEGSINVCKTPTTNDLISGIIDGFEEACERAGLSTSLVTTFSHGSTVAVNTLIEGTGGKTALVTTDGFNDLLEFGEMYRDESLLYDPCGNREQPLIPRKRRYGVEERIDSEGRIETPLDRASVDDVIETMKAERIESVAICFLHSYRNPEHERTVRRRLEEAMPGVTVSVSSEVSPLIREYNRMSTTAVDAYVKPEVGDYLSKLEETLRETGYESSIAIMKSDGGLAHPHVASSRPVTQILSGPIAGVKAAQYVGRQLGIEDILTLDMGGTSCDTSLIEGGEPIEVPYREMRGMKVNGPFVHINTVGAGGGSIAWVDDVDALHVGPKSAGADPGPACYGRGGDRPTVTDSDLVLGLLNPENFAGGALALDEDRAYESIETHVTGPLSMSVIEAARAIREVIDSKMASAIRVVSVEEGYDPRGFTLLGFGGAGPVHACTVAAELGMERVVFPTNPGLLASLGLLVADIKHEYVGSIVETLDALELERIEREIADMKQQGNEHLASEDVPPKDRSFGVSCDLKYAGQAYYLNVRLDATESLSEADVENMADRFEERHRERYGFVDDRNPIELVNVRLTATGERDSPAFDAPDPDTSLADAKRGEREVVVGRDTSRAVPYYDWALTPTDSNVPGPAIFEMENSTIWIPPGWDTHVDDKKNVVAMGGDR